MSDMCQNCAFRKTCATWHEPRNRVVSQIAASGAVPFYCHEQLDWQNPITHVLPASILARITGNLRLCEGWKAAVAARQWPAEPELRTYQRWLAQIALATADRFFDGRASVAALQRDLRPLDRFYKGPRAWQIKNMLKRLLEFPAGSGKARRGKAGSGAARSGMAGQGMGANGTGRREPNG